MLTWIVPRMASPIVPPRFPMNWGSEDAMPICFLGAEFCIARKVGEKVIPTPKPVISDGLHDLDRTHGGVEERQRVGPDGRED